MRQNLKTEENQKVKSCPLAGALSDTPGLAWAAVFRLKIMFKQRCYVLLTFSKKDTKKHACIGLHFSGSESDDLPAPPPPAEAGEGTALEVETSAVTPGGGLVGSSSDATANQGEDETNANLEFKSMLDSQNNVPVSQSSSFTFWI